MCSVPPTLTKNVAIAQFLLEKYSWNFPIFHWPPYLDASQADVGDDFDGWVGYLDGGGAGGGRHCHAHRKGVHDGRHPNLRHIG